MIVDDDPALLRSAGVLLRKGGISNVLTVERGREALHVLAEERIGVLILDLALPDLSGQEVLEQVTSEYPEVSVIIMTAATELDTVIDCMRKGASDYLVKPVDNNRFISAVFRAIEVLRLREEVYALKERFLVGEVRNPHAFARIITQNKKMRLLFQYVEAVAGSRQPVLITGETGVGKELFAEAIHAASHCKGKLIAVNVAGLDDTMFT
ncbi:MAG: sigma-54-dependent transcriptional regulator, partial [Gammaproteobacteria bacterium]